MRYTIRKFCLYFKRIFFLNVFLFAFFFSNLSYSDSKLPKLFFFFLPDTKLNLPDYRNILSNPYVSGAQIVYTWNELEPKKGVYDFSRIENDMRFLSSIHKKLFIQLQDRSFQPDLYYVPDYLRNEEIYHGGVAMQYDFPGEGKPITEGWVARVWDPAVRDRFQLLIKKLSEQFDGKIYGINFPETAVDFDPNNLPEGFTPDKYFYAELDNVRTLRNAFHNSIVVQYVNFFPGEWNNDHNYMSRLFSYAIKNKIGLGGPDVVPYRKSHMNNSYPFFHKYGDKISEVGMAIQEPDYTYKKPGTDDYYTFSDFYTFTQDYLGASILFWNIQEPFLSNQLIPKLNNNYFEQNAGNN